MGGQARGVGVSGLPLPPPLHRCPSYLHPIPHHTPPPGASCLSLPHPFMLPSAWYTKGSHSPSTSEKAGDPLHGTAHPAALPGSPADGAPWCPPPRKPESVLPDPWATGERRQRAYVPASQPQGGVQPGLRCRHPDLTRTPVGLMPPSCPHQMGGRAHAGPIQAVDLTHTSPAIISGQPWGHSKARGQGCQDPAPGRKVPGTGAGACALQGAGLCLGMTSPCPLTGHSCVPSVSAPHTGPPSSASSLPTPTPDTCAHPAHRCSEPLTPLSPVPRPRLAWGGLGQDQGDR